MSEKFKEKSIAKIAETNMFEYGSSVIEDRALPDYRDGLKPVHRRILWGMHLLGLRSNAAKQKSAKVSGYVMGEFSPHGDLATYGAMVGMENASVSLIEGQGNWGNFSDPPAAARYTECRLSKYSDFIMLDRECLNVVPMLPNYTNTNKEPLYLPALLPNLLLNGTQGIAVGTTTNIPPFKRKGVVKLVKKALKGKEVSYKDCTKYLKFHYKYGAVCVSPKSDIKEYFKTGDNSLKFSCDLVEDIQKKTLTIIGIDPQFNEEKVYEKLMNHPLVQSFENHCEKDIKFVVKFKRTIGNGKNWNDTIDDIKSILTKSITFKTNVTIRKTRIVEGMKESTATFKKTTVPELINMWVRWRVKLETRRLEYRLSELKKELAYQELLKYAVSKIDIIMKVLKKKTNTLDEDLAKALRITLDQSKVLLDRQIRSLSRLSESKITEKIKELKANIAETKVLLKDPAQSVLISLENQGV